MTLTLTLTPEQEARLTEQATEHGQPNDQYALSLLDGALNATSSERRPFYETTTPQEWVAALNEWASSHDPNGPVLLNDSREVIYED